MIAHTTLHVSEYKKSKSFYKHVLATLGYHQNMEFGESAGFNDGTNTDFWISAEKSVVPTHIAFEAASRQQVEAFPPNRPSDGLFPPACRPVTEIIAYTSAALTIAA